MKNTPFQGPPPKKSILESHCKQHEGRKGKWINPLTAQRNAEPGPGRMNPMLLFCKCGFCR